MSVYDRKYSLRPLRIVQQSAEFDLGCYRITEQPRRSNISQACEASESSS